MVEHTLKTLPPYWYALYRGEKTFEVRKDDRAYQKGDVLQLRLYEPGEQKYDAGNVLTRVVTFVLPGGQFGIEPGYVVLGLGEQS